MGGRPLLKVPSRKLKCDRNKPGDRKPVKGVYESREYRRPQKGFDLPVPGKMVLDVGGGAANPRGPGGPVGPLGAPSRTPWARSG